MKLNHKIHINFKTFFLEGKFDFLKIGKTKEWILNNFPDPDFFENINDEVYKANIWTYGYIELHFQGDELYMIFSDYVYELDGGEHLTLDTWFLSNTNELKLKDILAILNDEQIEYAKKMRPAGIVQLELTSGVNLGFTLNELENEDYNDYLARVETESHNEFSLGYFELSKQ